MGHIQHERLPKSKMASSDDTFYVRNRACTVPLRNKRTKTYAKYANAQTRIRVCSCAYTGMAIRVYAYTKYTHMLISIYELAYCCFLCNIVVKCCFNGPVILGLYGLTKSLRAKYGRTSHSFTTFFK